MSQLCWTPSGVPKMTKFVRFHGKDKADGLDEIFWEDPMTYQPRKSREGRVSHWGLFPYRKGVEYINGRAIGERQMLIQLDYNKGQRRPEQQFVDALIAKKVKQLQGVDVQEYSARDYILYINARHIPKLPNSQSDRLWRRVRVSGGLPLSVFVDKVFTPLLGFVRNLHAHVINDYSDGALFGPEDCDAVDMVHLPQTGYGYIPDDDWKIAHIIREKGQTMFIQYDFGDNWYFDVTLEEVLSAEESNGSVVVLGGSGTHPPAEITPWHWAELLSAADRGSLVKRKEALQEMFAAMNYADMPMSWNYDLEYFSVEETQKAVSKALDSPASIRSLSKQFNQSFVISSGPEPTPSLRAQVMLHNKSLRKGHSIVSIPVLNASGEPTGSVLEEGVSTARRDNPNTTACANCGSPNNLRLCSGCKKRFFCSRSCQRAAWAQRHRKECLASKGK